jgi:hypothetical protein
MIMNLRNKRIYKMYNIEIDKIDNLLVRRSNNLINNLIIFTLKGYNNE